MKTKSGWRASTRRDDRRPEVVRRPRPSALAPRALEDVVHHQHRHVAAHAVALVGDRAERVDTAARRSGEKAFSWTTSGQAGKNGSRPFASTRRRPRRTRPGRARGRPRSRGRSTRGALRSRGGRARRGSGRSRGSARCPRSASALRAAARPSGPPRCGGDGVVADAVGRADDVGGRRSRAARARKLSRSAVVLRARSRSRPGCAPRRPSARPRRTRAPRSRPTRARARRRARSFLPSARRSSSSQTQVLIS